MKRIDKTITQLRQDVEAAVADARGARQGMFLLQERLNALAAEVEALKSASVNLSVTRTALLEHLGTSHPMSLVVMRTSRRTRPAAVRLEAARPRSRLLSRPALRPGE